MATPHPDEHGTAFGLLRSSHNHTTGDVLGRFAIFNAPGNILAGQPVYIDLHEKANKITLYYLPVVTWQNEHVAERDRQRIGAWFLDEWHYRTFFCTKVDLNGKKHTGFWPETVFVACNNREDWISDYDMLAAVDVPEMVVDWWVLA